MAVSSYVNGKASMSETDVKSNLEHGSWHMATNAEWFEPQRLNTFEFLATGLEDITKQGMETGTEGSSVNSSLGGRTSQEALRLSVSAAAIPSFSQNAIEINRGNTKLKYAGKPSFGTGSITVQDYIGLPTMEVLYAWQALSYNILTEKVGIANDYKKTCYLMEYTPDYRLVRRWKLEGCWISDISEQSFDHNSDGAHSVTVTFQYDRGMIDRNDT